MMVFYVMVPVAIVIVILAICVFNWAVNSGQYDDLDSPAHSILFDDDDPAHLAARLEHKSKQASEHKPADESDK